MAHSHILKGKNTVNLDASSGSVVAHGGDYILNVSTADIANYAREGADLLIEFADGQRLVIRDFFSNGGGYNNLILSDGNAMQIVDFSAAMGGVDGIMDAGVAYSSATAAAGANGVLLGILGLSAAGAGVAVAAGSGGSHHDHETPRKTASKPKDTDKTDETPKDPAKPDETPKDPAKPDETPKDTDKTDETPKDTANKPGKGDDSNLAGYGESETSPSHTEITAQFEEPIYASAHAAIVQGKEEGQMMKMGNLSLDPNGNIMLGDESNTLSHGVLSSLDEAQSFDIALAAMPLHIEEDFANSIIAASQLIV